MPQQGQLGEFEPRVYFGENSPEYSVVGAPEGSDHREFDHVAGDDGAAQTYTTFRGEGGPSLGNWFNRIVYAVKFRSEQILLSDAVNEQSQILYDLSLIHISEPTRRTPISYAVFCSIRAVSYTHLTLPTNREV